MNEDICYLYKKFDIIKKRGFIKGVGKGNDSIGRTFENLLGSEENNLEIPDFGEIEIKTKKSTSKSYIGLFNMTPSGKYYHEIERLRDRYGYMDSKNKKYKVLNCSIFSNKRTFVGIYYQFMLKVDRKQERIYLCIFDISGCLIEKDIYWDFDILKEKLFRKLKTLAFVKADRKIELGIEYFRYNYMKLYRLKEFNSFISLIENGIIRVSFKIGVFKSGKRCGQIHDHGTGFEIKECDLLRLYDEY